MVDLKELDLARDPDAKPTSNLPSPAAMPVTPGVSRPDHPREQPSLGRQITRALAMKIARFFGLTDYEADVAERVLPVVIIADISGGQMEEETRSGADYKVFQLDLSVAHARDPIPGSQDMVMSDVALTQLTVNGTFRLHVGDRDGILFGGAGLGVGTGFEMQPPEQTRLLLTNAAQPATTAELLVSSGLRVGV